MVGVALDIGFEFLGHRGDDALAHAGGAWVGLDVEADAVVGDRQREIVALGMQNDVNGTTQRFSGLRDSGKTKSP